ncbi:hypothetical protein NPIL_273791 [Nephila pilipes]|uniref:Uncharacterized protein n=1 Tax=Nephila pilipes TaxID=299642 RepID=A0A8X6UCX5_NEPPI|nr:hypothetical protein NPIL_273791 [Nephila pilipes]
MENANYPLSQGVCTYNWCVREKNEAGKIRLDDHTHIEEIVCASGGTNHVRTQNTTGPVQSRLVSSTSSLSLTLRCPTGSSVDPFCKQTIKRRLNLRSAEDFCTYIYRYSMRK